MYCFITIASAVFCLISGSIAIPASNPDKLAAAGGPLGPTPFTKERRASATPPAAPAANCSTYNALGDVVICYPIDFTSENGALQSGPDDGGWDIGSVGLSTIRRYQVVYKDTDETVRREDVEESVYGTKGITLRIDNGQSFAQTWTVTETAQITPENIGGTLSFSYSQTQTYSSDEAISCTVTDPFGVLVVEPVVNHKGGYIYVTDSYKDENGNLQSHHSTTRWDTDIPLPGSQGFVQGIYTCCGGNQIPFPCCYGDCQHNGS